jgi:hypothetical protein
VLVNTVSARLVYLLVKHFWWMPFFEVGSTYVALVVVRVDCSATCEATVTSDGLLSEEGGGDEVDDRGRQAELHFEYVLGGWNGNC